LNCKLAACGCCSWRDGNLLEKLSADGIGDNQNTDSAEQAGGGAHFDAPIPKQYDRCGRVIRESNIEAE